MKNSKNKQTIFSSVFVFIIGSECVPFLIFIVNKRLRRRTGWPSRLYNNPLSLKSGGNIRILLWQHICQGVTGFVTYSMYWSGRTSWTKYTVTVSEGKGEYVRIEKKTRIKRKRTPRRKNRLNSFVLS